MKHTAGPWKAGGHQDMVLYGPDDLDGDPTIIGVLQFRGNAIAIPESCYSVPSLTLQKKNARLISAAPDLLEALKAVKTFHILLGIDAYPVTDVMDRAISKAEGNQ